MSKEEFKYCKFWIFLSVFFCIVILGAANYFRIIPLVTDNSVSIRNIKITVSHEDYFIVKKNIVENKLIRVADIYSTYISLIYVSNLYDFSKIKYDTLVKRWKSKGFLSRKIKVNGYNVDVWYCFWGENKTHEHVFYFFPDLKILFDFAFSGRIEDFFSKTKIEVMEN